MVIRVQPAEAWSLTRVDPVSIQIAGPAAAALIRCGVRATG